MGATDTSPASVSATLGKLASPAAGNPATRTPSTADAVLPAQIEPATEPGEEDEFDVTEGWETRSDGSASADSSIYAHTYEHGRRYQSFKNGRYPIPNDDNEQDREDMKHAMMLELMDGELFFAPVGGNPQNILDIGTGTGELFSQGGTAAVVITGLTCALYRHLGNRWLVVFGFHVHPIHPTGRNTPTSGSTMGSNVYD